MRVRLLSALVAGPALLALALRARSATAADAPGANGPVITPAPAPAKPLDAEITSDTAAQFYEMRSPTGATVISRRRLTTTLGVAVYDLFDKVEDRRAPTLTFRARLRYDADYGGNAEETALGSPGAFIPGFSRGPVDLMYGYIEGQRFFDGLLGFRLGRQYVSDALGWWSFDGGLVKVTTPYYLAAEVYGGLEQRGGIPLSTSRFEEQGMWRGSHRDFGEEGEPSATTYPSFSFTHPAPAMGVVLESVGPNWVHGRVTWRRVYNTGRAFTQQFPDPGRGYPTVSGLRVSSDRIGYAAELNKDDLGGLKGGFAYDLYNQVTANAYGSADVYLGDRVIAGLDFDYFEPTYDADAIWNWFSKSAIMTPTARLAVQITDEFDIAGSGGARLFRTDGDPETFLEEQCAAAFSDPAQVATCIRRELQFDASSVTFARLEENREDAFQVDGIGNLAGRYRWRSAEIGARGMIEAGDRGRRVGGDLHGVKRFDGRTYTIDGRVSLYDWEDPIRKDRDATSFGYVVGAGWRPLDFVDLRAEWEHEMNRLVGQRFRVVGLLNLWVGR